MEEKVTNPRKGKINRLIWFLPGEYEKLMAALDGNYNDEVLDIMFAIYYRGDL